MGSLLDKILIDPSHFPDEEGGIFKILFLMAVYGFILFKASNLISDGSELLLLIPSVAGIVGSVVLPILGAVPDGMIVMFSGLGDNAQEELAVGVGALAGSTIMLLTIPWFFSLIAGRVSLDEHGVGAYKAKEKLTAPKWSLWRTGTNVKKGLRTSGFIMIATCGAYLLIQIPAFKYAKRKGGRESGSESESESGFDSIDSSERRLEHPWALVGFIFATISFIGYLVYQVLTANKESNKDKIAQVQHDAISKSLMSVSAVFAEQLFSGEAVDERSSLFAKKEVKARFDSLLREFFNRHDLDGNGCVDAVEMRSLLADLGEFPTKEEFDNLMLQMDTNHNGVIEFDEFHASMKSYIKHLYDLDNGVPSPVTVVVPDEPSAATATTTTTPSEGEVAQRSVNATSSELKTTGEDSQEVEEEGKEEDDGDEEEEVPDDLTHLSPKQQRIRIILRSCWMMGLGVLLVIVFSDPMVDVFSALGKALHFENGFYVAFVLGPLASNASELIAAINYSRKKTIRTATIGCESLIGAACMNNTFCLAIFFLIIYLKNLVWRFSAETMAIIFVEVAMLFFAYHRVQRLVYGIFIILLYPLSIGLVALLEKFLSWN